MKLRSRAQAEKLRALEAEGKLAPGTVDRLVAEAPGHLMKRVGTAPRERKSARAAPSPSVTREARRIGPRRGR